MREYEFSLNPILPYKGRIYDCVLIREKTGSVKTRILAYFKQCKYNDKYANMTTVNYHNQEASNF